MTARWQVGNDSPVWLNPRRIVWFLYRYLPSGPREDFCDRAGRLRTFKSNADAQAKADALNYRELTRDQHLRWADALLVQAGGFDQPWWSREQAMRDIASARRHIEAAL